jgi:hypothetical protein
MFRDGRISPAESGAVYRSLQPFIRHLEDSIGGGYYVQSSLKVKRSYDLEDPLDKIILTARVCKREGLLSSTFATVRIEASEGGRPRIDTFSEYPVLDSKLAQMINEKLQFLEENIFKRRECTREVDEW